MISISRKQFALKTLLAWLGALILLAILSLAFYKFSPNIAAFSMSDFRAGRIIDDGIFYDNTSMSEADIQNWLNARLTCDTNGVKTSEYGGGTDYNGDGRVSRAEWAQSVHGYTGKFVCLTNYYENPNTFENNLVSGVTPAGAISAAAIIKRAADAYHVSPKVLLVKLKKESPGPLTADDWPWPAQFDAAIGYACPDPPPGQPVVCDPAYKGFYRQISAGAWQINSYKVNYQSFRYKPFQSNYIQYNPDTNCGGTNVYIENYATAGLYNYTPYQPNPGALANYPGTAPCGAYGNRNFWAFYTEWFGGTIGPSYYAVYDAQSAFPTLEHNQKSTIFIRYKNAGSQTWYDSATASSQNTQPVVLATMGPVNRCSTFVDVTWYNCSRPTGLFSKVYEQDGVTLAPDQHVAKPTQIVEYSFVLSTPDDTYTGAHREYFAPIRESAPGWSWNMGADNVFLDVNVKNAYRASYIGQSPYPTISQNDRSKVFVRMKNTGSATWYDTVSASQNGRKPVVLATEGPVNRVSAFGASWDTYARRPSQIFSKVFEADGSTLSLDQHATQPGQIAEYEFLLTPLQTTNPGLYREYYRIIREGAKTFSVDGSGWYLDVTVRKSAYGASYVGQSPYPTVNRSMSSNIYFDLRNTGNTPWYDDNAWTPGILPVRLATTWPINRSSTFYDQSWFVSSRPKNTFSKVFEPDGATLSSNQHMALPNQVVRYEFPIKAPLTSGVYYEHFQPVIEGSPGSSWDMGGLVWTKITVQ